METDPLEILNEYIRHASVSTDPAYALGMEGARAYSCACLTNLGFSVETVQTKLHPIILAERKGDPDAPHIVIYGHYDVQPADPFELWESEPFVPTVRDGRLYGRGAADNKGPVAVQLAALARVFLENPNFPLNITYLIEGEEEMGSPSFPEFLEHYADRLKQADLVVLSDTGIPNHEQMVITTGLRGLCSLEVKLKGPNSDLHSGIYGGAVRNPLSALAEIVAGLHDADGRVTVEGFYDDVVEPAQWERDELLKMPFDEKAYQSFLGLPALCPPKGYNAFEAVRFMPTLEFNGMGGGYQGVGSKTIIPSEAFVKITCRLVPHQDPDKIIALVKAAIEARCPKGVTLEVIVREGGPAYHVIAPNRPNTPDDQSEALKHAFTAAEKAMQQTFGAEPIYLREGGSVPIIAQIKEATGLDSLMIGIFAPEDNLHAPNESFDIAFMEKATETYAAFFRGLV